MKTREVRLAHRLRFTNTHTQFYQPSPGNLQTHTVNHVSLLPNTLQCFSRFLEHRTSSKLPDKEGPLWSACCRPFSVPAWQRHLCSTQAELLLFTSCWGAIPSLISSACSVLFHTHCPSLTCSGLLGPRCSFTEVFLAAQPR